MFGNAEIAQNPVMGTTVVTLPTTTLPRQLTNPDDDDDSPAQTQQHHIGIDHRRPNETLSGGSVEKTFEKILKYSDPDKDVFTQDASGCESCCNGPVKPWIWIALGVFLIIAGIALFVLIGLDIVDMAALTAPIYCVLGGFFCILLPLFRSENVFEIDKRNKVIRTQTNYTFMDCANTCCGRSEKEIKFEDIDYVSIEHVADGFFDEDWVEDPTVKEEARRVPIKIARRNMYLEKKKKEQNDKKKWTLAHAAAAATPDAAYNTVSTSGDIEMSDKNNKDVEGSDAWLRNNFFSPHSTIDDENSQAAVRIRLYRKGAHSEVQTNNKDLNKQRAETRAICLETVFPKDGLTRIHDWEAYLCKLGVPLRRSVPYTAFLEDRKLINPYDTGVEEIKTSASIETSNGFWALILPTILSYVGLITLTQVFAVQGRDRRDEEMLALNITEGEPGYEKNITFLPWQIAIVVGLAVFFAFWMFFIIWLYARKVVLVVNKHDRTFTHVMTRYLCCCCADVNNSKDAVRFKFQDVRRLEICDSHKKSGGKGKSKLSNRTIELVYYDSGSNQEKSVVLQTAHNGNTVLGYFRAWKRFLIEDCKIELNQQPEDKMFEDFLRSEGELDAYIASLKKNDNNNHTNFTGVPAWYKKAKELDPSLYVDLVECEDEKTPMIM